MGTPTSTAETAWIGFTARMARLGQELAGPPFPTGKRATSEGYRYLSRLLVNGLQWAVEFADPDFPAFYRHDDDVTKWGGPNVDNTYLRARVRAGNTYRIVGNGASSHGFLISTHEGDMQLEQYGVYAELWHDDLVTDDDGGFELIVGPDERPGNWMPLHPDATNITIRQYFNDWTCHTPGEFAIERMGSEGEAPPPISPEALAERLNDAGSWIEASVRYWNQYVEGAHAECGDNTLQPPRSAKGGAEDIAYGAGFFKLAEDETFVIEGEPPDAWSWNIMLYTMGWMESLDFANRLTSLNGTQIHLDPDGRYRVVIAHRDPGVPNWIDTTGLEQAMIAYRYIRTANRPVPTGSVVKLPELRATLPASTPQSTPEGRTRQIRIRQRHVARRFRR